MSARQILACPECSFGKSRNTHTFGTYRVYLLGTTLTLKCKTCGAERKYRFIQGGIPNKEDRGD